MQAQLDAVQGKTHIKKEPTSSIRGKAEIKNKRDSSPVTESPDDSDNGSEYDSNDDLVESRSDEKKTLNASSSKLSISEQEIEDNNPKELNENDKKSEDKENQSDEDYDKSIKDNKSEHLDKLSTTSEDGEKDKVQLDDPNVYDEDVQLFGPEHNMKMVDIGQGIYCTEYRFNLANSSREGTIMIRHLMEGVFRHDKILDCTLTGQPPRNKPKDTEVYHPLHTKATPCLINYVLKCTTENKWMKKTKHGFVAYTWETLQHAMSQRLGEIKRTNTANSELQPKSGC